MFVINNFFKVKSELFFSCDLPFAFVGDITSSSNVSTGVANADS